jgi:hypothetical protein
MASTADKVDATNHPYGNDPYHPYSTWSDWYGYGRINAYKALSLANEEPDPPQEINWQGSAGQHPTIVWPANGEPDIEGYNVFRYTPVNDVWVWLKLNTSLVTGTSFTDLTVTLAGQIGVHYRYYRVTAVDAASQESNPSVSVAVPLSGDDPAKRSTNIEKVYNLSLHQNYPNPFNPSTTIRFSLPSSGFVSLTVFDVLGQEIRTLLNEMQALGEHTVTFDAGNMPSGLYFYRLQHNGNTLNGKMLLAK